MGKAVLSFVFAAMTAAISAAEIVSGSGFVQAREKGAAAQKTSFKIDGDRKRIVVTVECTDTEPAKLPRDFHDPDKFNKVAGFPERDKEDDVTVESATASKPDELRLKCSVLGGALACPISTPIEPGFEAK